jgi:hypothetical protein
MLFLKRRSQPIDSVVVTIESKPEYLEVGGNAEGRPQVDMGLNGLGWSHMDDGPVSLLGLGPERGDGKERRPDGREAAGNLAEMRSIPCVPGKEDIA